MTVIPYELIKIKQLKGLTLLKMVRIRRLPRIISGSYMKESTKNLLRIFHLIFQLILTFHLFACLWAYIVHFSKEWVPPNDYINPKAQNYFKFSVEKKYFTAMYYAIISLNGGEIGPRNTLEYAFASMIVLSGAIIYSNLFGNMMLYIESLRYK